MQRPKESTIDVERLNSARRRLQENYQEAQNGLVLHFEYNTIVILSLTTYWLVFHLLDVFFLCEAKKQRTIQVMDIHEIPKPKNAYFAKNKGGFQGRHHRWLLSSKVPLLQRLWNWVLPELVNPDYNFYHPPLNQNQSF